LVEGDVDVLEVAERQECGVQHRIGDLLVESACEKVRRWERGRRDV